MSETKAMPAGDRSAKIAELNDWLREHITSPGHNRAMISASLNALIGDTTIFRNWRRRAELLRTVRAFNDFNPRNDPHHERDGALFEFEGETCYWKVDYYNLDLSAGSEDPTDPFQTVRVLTIMHRYDM